MIIIIKKKQTTKLGWHIKQNKGKQIINSLIWYWFSLIEIQLVFKCLLYQTEMHKQTKIMTNLKRMQMNPRNFEEEKKMAKFQI